MPAFLTNRQWLAVLLAVFMAVALSACGGGGGGTTMPDPDPMPEPMPTAYEQAMEAIAAATTAADAQAAYDAVKDDVTAAQGEMLQAAVDARIEAINMAARVQAQTMALMGAAANIDTSDLSTAAAIAAANNAIAALEAALNAAADLTDAQKAPYQTQLDDAKDAVSTAQTHLDTQGRMMAQRMAISNAVTMARTAVNGVNNDSTDTEVSSADSAIAALKAAIAGAADLPAGDADVASAQGTVETLEAQLNTAKTARTAALDARRKAEMAAMAKAGKDMRGALGGAAADTNALANIAAHSLAATGSTPLSIDAAAGAGALADATDPPAVALRTGDSAGSLGGWAGTNYARSTGSGSAMVTNEARVYINKGPGDTGPFSGTNGKYTLITTAGATRGYVLLGDAATPVTRASATDFTHSGTQTHQTPSQRDAFYTRGTYDGAPGEFRCASTNCSSTNDGKGTVSALGGTWHFKPDAGAMVNTPDAHYLYYGWWVSKDNDGDPTAASAFAGRVGIDPGDSTDGLDAAVAGGDLTGSATYAGNAVGKFAMSNPLDGTGNGGHFTADAELEATFGTGATAGMTGTIDNFRLNDGSDDPGWSVSLHRAAWAAGGVISAPVDDTATTGVNEALGTTWSIGDTSTAGRSGTWSGQMYDETPGDPSSTGPGDGSNVPTTVTGTFYSEFSSIGRMVGAFGADKQ
ncbi:MAG: hypothetical protein OXK82_07790 [Deltaproteobacteria bacterium]|nr:hypothetical protein [Deltaproteobacteria bacterium]